MHLTRAPRCKKLESTNRGSLKGWFNQTLPGATFPNGIAILPMDADWYDSTMDIFNNLFDQVNPYPDR